MAVAAHEAPAAVLDRQEADWLRAYAASLAAELPRIATGESGKSIWAWAGEAQLILEEMARG